MSPVSIPFNRPSLIGDELKHVQEAIERGQLSGDGYFTKACNAQLVQMTEAKAALLTHSCTAALEMAAILCDLQPDDEVIMPSFTFVSTANAVALRGAVPVFVDIRPETLNIDPDQVKQAVTDKTKAIFAVHYAGFPADMDALAQIARSHDLLLVEDAAQALGSTYKGRPAGSLGDMAAFSFHETKNIISGEGGALTIMRPDLIERAEIIREKGTNRSLFLRGQVDKYTWVDIGSSFLPGELVAAFLNGQLEQADAIKTQRLALYDRYRAAFSDLAATGRVQLPLEPEGTTGNGHMFYFLMRDLEDRQAFITHMRDAGIIAPFHYVPLHSAPAGLKHARFHGNRLPVTDDITARLVRLPLFYELNSAIDAVISEVQRYFTEQR
ncbi:dTDP-4-amino-4,6-dideoxygalactose transaminase [Rhodosalinus sp. 5P4]|uniref:dTDP-4-amino-4,6-dideoxygalactose transaminase n=1 Tax=Rhodosalinus sp. 5P4 TaxID=3239196 RepID=UPI003524FF9E